MSEAEASPDEKREMATRLMSGVREEVVDEHPTDVAEDILDRIDAAQAAGKLEGEAKAEDLVAEAREEVLSELSDQKQHSARDRATMKQRITDVEMRELSELGRERREELVVRELLARCEENGGVTGRITTTDLSMALPVSQRSVRNYCQSIAGRHDGIDYAQLGGKYRGVNQKGLKLHAPSYDGPHVDDFDVHAADDWE